MSSDRAIWQRRGDAARLAHEAVHNAFRAHVRDNDPATYTALLHVFRHATALALPSSDPRFLPNFANGQAQAIEAAIAFLEADPWFFRSGYEKQNLIRYLKRASLDDAQKRRLANVVIAAIDSRDRQEFRHYGRLACGVWSDDLDEQVANRMRSDDEGVRRRATWIAEAAISAGKA